MARNPSHRTYERRWNAIKQMPDGVPSMPKPVTDIGYDAASLEDSDVGRLFTGVRPTGITYCDREREEQGDYRKLAFHSFSGEVSWYEPVPSDLRALIEADIQRHPAGTTISTSASGQTATFR